MTNQQFNDPDFDQPSAQGSGASSQSPLGQLSPKMLFFGGIIAGVLVLCTIGFFILLSIMLRGGVIDAQLK